MRRIVLWLASTVTVVVLLFGYHTSTNEASPVPAASSPNSPTSSASSGPSAAPSSSASSSTAPSSTPSATSSASSSATKTYTGSVAQTRWGPVQVQISVRADKVTNVEVLQQPNGNRKDVEINDYALPTLISETLQEQSAQIDMVSGATVTSEGYLESLQAALDEAGI